jgi:hypothetical protein
VPGARTEGDAPSGGRRLQRPQSARLVPVGIRLGQVGLVFRQHAPAREHRLDEVVLSEAGAPVYSASEYSSLELPALGVSLHGAVRIARCVQDPLALSRAQRRAASGVRCGSSRAMPVLRCTSNDPLTKRDRC